jgi:hypothetical protein
MYIYLVEMRQKKIANNGPMMCEQARSFGHSFGFMDFKGNTRWLHQFLKRHGMWHRIINGGEDDTPRDVTTSWKESN